MKNKPFTQQNNFTKHRLPNKPNKGGRHNGYLALTYLNYCWYSQIFSFIHKILIIIKRILDFSSL